MLTPKLLWITDPWTTLDHQKDTTLRLMHEAISMGVPTFWSPSDQLLSASTTGYLSVAELTHPSQIQSLHTAAFKPLPVSTFHQIHDRIDPPVDAGYRNVIETMIRLGVKPEQILNPPHLIQFQSEKIPPDELLHLSPKMRKVDSEKDIPVLIQQFDGIQELVSKPLNLAQSIGVRKFTNPETPEAWSRKLKELKAGSSDPILIEEFLPEIDSGEVRLWFAGRTLIGALRKFPIQGDFRVLIDQGSRIEKYELNGALKEIALEIGNTLEKKGILLAAVDLIGTKICDFNITSPGLLVQLEQVHQKNFAREILNRALQFRAQKDHG